MANSQRIAMVDALRGCALFFILISNVPLDPQASAAGTLLHKADSSMNLAWTVLVSRKFITIFSILFGYGLYKLLERAGKEDRRKLAIRMIVLFVLGLVHGYLFWFGDIIRSYAFCGLLLLLIAHWPTRRLLITSVVLTVVCAGVVFIGNAALGWQQYDYDPALASSLALIEQWPRYWSVNFTIDPWRNFLQDMPLTLFFCMGNIILGFVLGRKGWLEQMATQKMVAGWKLWAMLLFGLGCSTLLWLIEKGEVELSVAMLWLPFLIIAGLICQSMAYILLFGRWAAGRLQSRWLSAFAAVGRMSLSNYLLQTVWYLLLFYHLVSPWALFGKVGATITYGVCVLLFGVQVLASKWWLRRFEVGPAEFVFRWAASTLSKKRESRA